MRHGSHCSSTSGPIPKFVSYRGTLVYELRNLRTTSNSMILVPLLNPKFVIAFAARCARTSGSGHWPPPQPPECGVSEVGRCACPASLKAAIIAETFVSMGLHPGCSHQRCV